MVIEVTGGYEEDLSFIGVVVGVIGGGWVSSRFLYFLVLGFESLVVLD